MAKIPANRSQQIRKKTEEQPAESVSTKRYKHKGLEK